MSTRSLLLAALIYVRWDARTSLILIGRSTLPQIKVCVCAGQISTALAVVSPRLVAWRIQSHVSHSVYAKLLLSDPHVGVRTQSKVTE